MATTAQLVERRHAPYHGDFRFFRTVDADVIRSILTNPKIYRAMAEQNTAPVAEFVPPIVDAIWYILAFDGNELLGCYILIPENSACWSIHLGLLPLASWVRGRPVAAMLAVFDWIWRETPCMRIIGKVPVFNSLALRLAVKAGMIMYGRNVLSFPKSGKLWDEVLLGISRPGVK